MAIYHFTMKPVSRGTGRSVTAAAAYRAATRIHDLRTGKSHDYTAKRGVLSNVVLAPSRAPEWARDPERLWNEVEQNEKRKDARLARENIVALPHELDLEQNTEWLHLFVEDHYVKRGMVAQVSVHSADHEGDKRNIHAHILLTDRQVTRNGFKEKKVRTWNDKSTLKVWREAFADYQNRALKEHGHEARVDHRSYRERGIDREPMQHIGPAANQIQRERKTTEIGRKNELTKSFNRNLEAMKKEAQKLELQIKQEQDWILAKQKALQDAMNERHWRSRKSREITLAEQKALETDNILGRLTGQKHAAQEKERQVKAQLKSHLETRLIEAAQAQEMPTVIPQRPSKIETFETPPPEVLPPQKPKMDIELRAARKGTISQEKIAPLPGVKREIRQEQSVYEQTKERIRKALQQETQQLSSDKYAQSPASKMNEREHRIAQIKEQFRQASQTQEQDNGLSM